MTKEELIRGESMDETLKALKSMGAYKLPGPAGFPAIFFKKTWNIVREEVHSFVRKMLEDGEVSE